MIIKHDYRSNDYRSPPRHSALQNRSTRTNTGSDIQWGEWHQFYNDRHLHQPLPNPHCVECRDRFPTSSHTGDGPPPTPPFWLALINILLERQATCIDMPEREGWIEGPILALIRRERDLILLLQKLTQTVYSDIINICENFERSPFKLLIA